MSTTPNNEVGQPYPLPPEGHDYDIPLPYWHESMPIPYSRNPLGEVSYTPGAHDDIVDRHVRLGPDQGGQPHQTPWYAAPRNVDGDGPKPVGV